MNLALTNLKWKNIATAAIALIFVIFLVRNLQNRDFHDPLLRQQLTQMTIETSDDNVLSELDSIINVNSAKLSKIQLEKLKTAREKLSKAIAEHNSSYDVSSGRTRESLDKDWHEFLNDSRAARQLIAEAAGTF